MQEQMTLTDAEKFSRFIDNTGVKPMTIKGLLLFVVSLCVVGLVITVIILQMLRRRESVLAYASRKDRIIKATSTKNGERSSYKRIESV